MAGKVKHLWKRGDVYWARMAVPKHLQPIIGKVQLHQRLAEGRTTAERMLPGVVYGFQRQLAAAQRKHEEATGASARPRPRQAPLSLHELAHAHYAESLAFDDELRNTSSAFSLGFIDQDRVADLRRAVSGAATNAELEASVGTIIAKFAERGVVAAEPGTPEWRGMARILAGIELEALQRSAERDEGDFAGKPAHPLLTEPLPAKPEKEERAAVSLMALLDAYLKEKAKFGKGAEARRRWTPVFKGLVEFLGHDDAERITKAKVFEWVEHLLEKKSPKTVKDTDLGSLKAVLTWAHSRDKITSNPTTGVKLETERKTVTREKGFTDEEAAAILNAAKNYQPKASTAPSPRAREAAPTTAAKRWVPWLCAFTGARVAEMTQLRGEDVQERDGIPFIKITPDAGSVKTSTYRLVPLHPQLVELGFLDFVKGSGSGPLFYLASERKEGGQHPSKQVAGRLSSWLRSLDLFHDEVDPSHGWRHRFKTVARELGLDPRVVDAIQGHAARTAGENYGDVTLKAKQSAINKFPAIKA